MNYYCLSDTTDQGVFTNVFFIASQNNKFKNKLTCNFKMFFKDGIINILKCNSFYFLSLSIRESDGYPFSLR
jgi:hypothetical protein